ncbi:MAG: zinc-dependent alcohol dehydrogenase [Pirellulaceae bacterium]
MKAITWHGKNDVRVERVPDPQIVNPKDAIIHVTSTAICGSDLHLYAGRIPAMQEGDVLGHEFMGEVVAVGNAVENLKEGDRVVVPFAIACGNCYFCQHDLYSLCDNSNPDAAKLEALYGYAGSGLFGYSHLFGGYAGGQAEYVRVPFADVGPLKVPEGMEDERALFLSDIFPTGYMAAENCNIQEGDTVAVWGCGPVGQFAIWSALKLGAGKVIAIDRFEERLSLARRHEGCKTLNYEDVDVFETLKEETAGRGPDACIDAVGSEAHGASLDHWYDLVKNKLMLETDRGHVLRQVIHSCRKGGTISLPGVYGGFLDKFPIGAAFGKGLQLRMGQTHVHRYLPKLLEYIQNGEIDPTYLITHRGSLEDGPKLYQMFKDKEDDCVKCVLDPSRLTSTNLTEEQQMLAIGHT